MCACMSAFLAGLSQYFGIHFHEDKRTLTARGWRREKKMISSKSGNVARITQLRIIVGKAKVSEKKLGRISQPIFTFDGHSAAQYKTAAQ